MRTFVYRDLNKIPQVHSWLKQQRLWGLFRTRFTNLRIIIIIKYCFSFCPNDNSDCEWSRRSAGRLFQIVAPVTVLQQYSYNAAYTLLAIYWKYGNFSRIMFSVSKLVNKGHCHHKQTVGLLPQQLKCEFSDYLLFTSTFTFCAFKERNITDIEQTRLILQRSALIEAITSKITVL